MDCIYRDVLDNTIDANVFYTEYTDDPLMYTNRELTLLAKAIDVYDAFVRGRLLVRCDICGYTYNVHPDIVIFDEEGYLYVCCIDDWGERVVILVSADGKEPPAEKLKQLKWPKHTVKQ